MPSLARRPIPASLEIAVPGTRRHVAFDLRVLHRFRTPTYRTRLGSPMWPLSDGEEGGVVGAAGPVTHYFEVRLTAPHNDFEDEGDDDGLERAAADRRAAVAPYLVEDLAWVARHRRQSNDPFPGRPRAAGPVPIVARLLVAEYPTMYWPVDAIDLRFAVEDHDGMRPEASAALHHFEDLGMGRSGANLFIMRELHVHPALRNRGVGLGLMSHVLELFAAGSDGAVLLQACPVPSIWDDRDAEGPRKPFPEDEASRIALRLAARYEGLGFTRITHAATPGHKDDLVAVPMIRTLQEMW